MKPDPDLERLVDTALAELRTQILKELSDGTASHGTLDQIEEAVSRIGDHLRRSLQEQIVAQRTPLPRDNPVDSACGHSARYRTTRTRLLTTRHGDLAVARPYYYCSACRRGFAPLDADLGLDAATATATVQGWMADLAARLPFDEAVSVLDRLTQVSVSPATVERTAVALGQALGAEQRAQAASHPAGRPPAVLRKPKRLYISLDGTFVPLRDPWKRDGSVGALVCRFGECKTAVLYEAHATPRGDRGVARSAYTATLCGAKGYSAIAEWGRNSGGALARALGFTRSKTPCASTFCLAFRALDRLAFERALAAWAESALSAVALPEGEKEALAIDGKTLRGSAQQGALDVHLLSVLSQRLGLTLYQQAVSDKTHEIGAIQEVLAALVLEGRVVTMDALLCQRNVAQTIRAKGGTT